MPRGRRAVADGAGSSNQMLSSLRTKIMSLRGNLHNLPANRLFNIISLARKTGVLSVRGRRNARLSFRSGKLIHAWMENSGSSLAQILWQSGFLSTSQARTVQAHAKDLNEKQVASLLIQTGRLTHAEIIRSITFHMRDIAHELTTWSQGEFLFREHVLPSKDLITVAIDLESVIIEGSQWLEEWERLQEELPDLDVRLKCPSQPQTRLQNIQLTLREWRVMVSSNARNTMRQIARANQLSIFQTRRIVYGLLQAGLVELVPAPQPVPIGNVYQPPLRQQRVSYLPSP